MILIEKKEEKMAEKMKKSFYVGPDLFKRWEDFHQSKQDHSVSGAAAMVLWLSLEDMPGLREQLRKIGQGPNYGRHAPKSTRIDPGRDGDADYFGGNQKPWAGKGGVFAFIKTGQRTGREGVKWLIRSKRHSTFPRN